MHDQVDVVDYLKPQHAAPDSIRNVDSRMASPRPVGVRHRALLIRFEQDVFVSIDHIDPTTFMNTPWCLKLRSVRSSEKSVKL